MTHEEHGHGAVSEHGHGHGVVAENPFADPGLPEHQPRLTDIDPKAAKRSERIAAGLFMLSAIATIGFMVCYTQIPNNRQTLVNFGRIVDGILSIITYLVSFILMCSRPDRRCLHDLIAGTVVLYDPNKVLANR